MTEERGPRTTSPEEEARLQQEEQELRLREEQQLQELRADAEAGLQTSGTTAAATGAVGAEIPMQQATLWGDAWRQLRRNPLFIGASLLLLVFALIAVWPSLFTHQDPRNCDILLSVDTPRQGHWFGFDIQGCDYYSRVIHGTSKSLFIGLVVVGIDVLIALVLGSLAGYYGRWSDAFISRGADIFFAIPTVLGGIVLLNALGSRSFWLVCLVLITLGWPTLMRLMRSSVLAGKEMDYVQAAKALGASDFRIMRKHILPNGIAPVIVYATITVGIIIAAEAALTFLGVGLQAPAISWGLMISQAQNRLLTSPHLLFFPSVFLSLLVLSFILMGEALRDALDPRLR